MSEDQAKYNEYEQNISADAEKPEKNLSDKLWNLFDLGMRAGRYSNMRVLSDRARNDAAQIIKELSTIAQSIEEKS